MEGGPAAKGNIVKPSPTVPSYSEEAAGEDNFLVFGRRVYRLFNILLGDIDFTELTSDVGGMNRSFAVLLLLVHVVYVYIMLINLLIAMMGDTYSDIQNKSEMAYLFWSSQVMLYLEKNLQYTTFGQVTALLQKCGVRAAANPEYWVLINGKRYITHVTKDYSKLDTCPPDSDSKNSPCPK